MDFSNDTKYTGIGMREKDIYQDFLTTILPPH